MQFEHCTAVKKSLQTLREFYPQTDVRWHRPDVWRTFVVAATGEKRIRTGATDTIRPELDGSDAS